MYSFTKLQLEFFLLLKYVFILNNIKTNLYPKNLPVFGILHMPSIA